MKRLIAAAAVAFGALGLVFGAAAPAQSAVNICGKVKVVVNGDALLDESHCQVIPPAEDEG